MLPVNARLRRSGSAGWLAGVMVGATTCLCAPAALAQPTNPGSKRILSLPTIQWDQDLAAWSYAAGQTVTNLTRVMGGLSFGLAPEEVNKLLPYPAPSLQWPDLPVAPEFPEEVRYVWLPMAGGGALRAAVKSCFGEPSYIVLMFRAGGLFRVSWRFLPDPVCRNPGPAAAELYAAFVPIDSQVAISAHYQSGYAEVVDVSDPSAGILINQRWQMRGQ